jgi:hypothetical protein
MNLPDELGAWAKTVRDRPIWVRVIVAVGIALVFAGCAYARMGRDHEYSSDLKIALAIAGVIAVLIVAPGRFSGQNNDATDWSDEVKAIREQENQGRKG